VQEIQTVTTSTYTDANEIQTITTTSLDSDEVQLVTTNATVLYEIQTVETKCDPGGTLGGTFALGLDTTATGGSAEMSGEISFDAAGEGSYLSLKRVLENMKNVGPGGVVGVDRAVTDSAKGAYLWTVTFATHLGNLPEITLRDSSLTGTGATVDLATVRDQNLLGGSFRLSFGGYTTAAIPHDATGGEVASALEALSTVDSVDVYRVGPTDQGGYNWTVTYTSDYNGADLPEMVATYVDLTGSGASAVVTTLRDGNELSGTFNLTFSDPVAPKFGWESSATVAFDATPSSMKAALESLGTGEVAVHRSGPDFELGYVWTVSFVEKEGDLPLLGASSGDGVSMLNGDLSKVRVRETRKGTVKEVQTISTFGGADGAVNSSTKFFLRFRGQTTGVIEANPNSTANKVLCDATAREVQQIRTSTVDTFGAGGDDHVSSLLYFSLVYYGQDGSAEETRAIDANPQGGDCEVGAASIEAALLSLDALEEVTVNWSEARDDEGCTWRVTFDDQSGNLDQMSVKVQGGANTGASAVGFWGDDTISMSTVRDGTVDAIKYELEKLTTVGTVTVDPANATEDGGCSWRVTFETNTGESMDAGALTPLTVASLQKNGTAGSFSSSATAWPDATDSVSVCDVAEQCVAGTSVQLGGQWTAQFRGHRTLYVDHDVSARGVKEALEALPTVGRVDVTREGPDENLGFTWSVTFLTELGDLPPLIIDQQALTGTAPFAVVAEHDSGVFPPFDSLDPSNGLPLGSTTLTNLDDLSHTVGSLEQGIPYYFRMSAINANGQGPAALASPSFAVPLPQSASSPTSVKLAVVDGGALAVSLASPERDGGEEVDRYRVEYATQQFAQEVQAVRVACQVEPEIQTVATDAQDVDEVQVVHAQLEAGYDGLTQFEVQEVICDATAGSFTLSVFGETTADIFVADSEKDIQARLQELSRLNSVNVSFPSGVHQACADCADNSGSGGCATGFNVTFQDVEGASGDMPVLKPDVKGLHGNRRVNVVERVRGAAGLGGSFRLTFRGFTTVDIHHNASAAEVQAALEQLDPIPYDGGVSVERVADTGFERMWRVTFATPEVGGDVESLVCPDHDMRLHGNGAQLTVHSNGMESALNRRYTEPSVRGNQVGGAFTLSLLGHTTEPIDFNAADTQMKARLESLPNIGTVDVTRSSPTPEKGYTWTVTFVSNPGSFPVASSDVEPLAFDLSGLSGSNVTGNVSEVRAGYWPLGGTFQLRYTNGTQWRTTTDLAHNSDPSEVKAALESLDDMVGKVSVQRSTNVDGYSWSVTFGPCQTDPVTGADVCNEGDLYPLELVSNNTLEGCSAVSVSVAEVVQGSGPDLCPLRDSGLCFDDVTDLSGGAPYTYEIAQLDVGTPYYVRVAAHTDESFGTFAASTPEFAVPSHLQPGAPPRVRLTSSTETTITLEWDRPTEDGGSPVTGYELWMDDWEGGNMLKVYDGTADEETLGFTVDSANAPHLESGRKYQFTVRAINLCRATDDDLACYSDFSLPAVFTVRAPRPPLAPPQVLRDSAGTSTGARGVWGDGSITVYWVRPVDNGGSPITAYRVFMESPDGNVTQVLLDPASASLAVDQSQTKTPLVGHERQYRHTFDSLDEGEVYVFQVAAVNMKGRSGLSAPLAVVCAERPGGALSGEGTTDANKTASFGLIKPTVVDVTASSVELSWDEPSDRGMSPITGYQVYMYPGAALNSQADPEPVKQEVQVITTAVSTPVSEMQVLTITDARTGGQFRLRVRASSAVGGVIDETTELITLGACDGACLKAALQGIGSGNENSSLLGSVDVSGPVVQNSSHAYTITFADYSGPLQALALVDHSLVDKSAANTWYHSVVRVVKGTEPIRGTYTVAFRGFETPALPYNVSAYELERELNNLDSIDMVTVSRTEAYNDDALESFHNGTSTKAHFGAFAWTVTFVNVMGDVPLLYPSPGRLTCSAETSACVGVDTVAVQPGTDAVLVYDGTHAPNVRDFVATGLTTDALYAFKVVPLNAVGRGLPSAATATVAARVGASASQTTVRGGSVSVGMAGYVHETQVITAYDTDGHFSLTLGSWYGESLPLFAVTVGSAGKSWDKSSTRNELNDPNDEGIVSSAAAVEAALTIPGTGINQVHVTRSAAAAVSGSSGVSWTVTFLSPLGNVPTLRVNSTNLTSGSVNVVELLAGASNEFTIEPKKASGAPVKDVTARSNFGTPGDTNGLYSVDFTGQDLFFTELWTSNVDVLDGTHTWDSDGGVAAYSPVLYEIQRLFIPGGTSGGFRLKFDQTSAWPGKKDQVCAYVSGGFGEAMQDAPSAYDGATWLGGGNDGSHGYECTGPLATLGGQGAPRLLGESFTTANITVNSTALQVKLALEQLPNIEAVDVTYQVAPSNGDMTYLVTFTHDLGDLPLLQYVSPMGDAVASGTGLSTYMNVSEVQEGFTEVQTITTDADIGFTREVQSLGSGCEAGNASGFFNLTLPGADKWVRIPSNANATVVKRKIESLSNVGKVKVTRQALSAHAGDQGGHFLWSVTFYDPVGDVPDLKVSAAGLTGGSQCYVDVNEVTKGASPLGGTFVVSFGADYTDDLDFDASAVTMKAALEALPSIDQVNVRREDLGTGHRWEVTFTKALGNLPEMVTHMHRYEEQHVRTLGGDPTPLGGSFSLRYGGAATAALPHDASANAVKTALEALPTVDHVDCGRDVFNFGQYRWRVTFRSEVGDLPMLVADTRLLTGSDARATVAEQVAGDGSSLTGSTPFVRVAEKSAGLPSYSALYHPDKVGPYTLAVRQLTKGGLAGQYFDNQWLLGDPSVERVDPALAFDWGTGTLTRFGRDYVSARWVGKVVSPSSELYTLYLYADDGARLWIDHELVIDAWDASSSSSGQQNNVRGGYESRCFVNLTEGVFHDIRLEYKEETGKAAVKLEWSSFSTYRSTVPSSAFYYASHVSGSPYQLTVLPGASDYPYTSAEGAGLAEAVAGEPAFFTIQARDENGNARVSDEAAEDGDFLNISLYRHNRQLGQLNYADSAGLAGSHYNGDLTGFYGAIDTAPSTMGKPEYLGDGRYRVSYTVLKSGYWKLHVKSGGTDIECGRGSAGACSPFTLFVDPGPTIAQTTEVEGALSPLMDGLVEAAAGDMAYFSIQAKDTYGNNRIVGGDEVRAVLAYDDNRNINYRGHVNDHKNGTYLVTYTVPKAGMYKVDLTIGGQRLNSCTPPVYSPKFRTRQYDGLRVYHAPHTCGVEATSLLVVHGPLQASQTTAVETTASEGLTKAVVGVRNTFTVEARDEFGNLRAGDGTNHFGGYGSGQRDPFTVDFSGPSGYSYKTSSAVMTLRCNNSFAPGFFRLGYDGATSVDLPLEASASAIEAAVYTMHPGDPHLVRVTRSDTAAQGSDSLHSPANKTFAWSVTFLSHLDRWAEVPMTVEKPSGVDSEVVVPTDGSFTTKAFESLKIEIVASRGLYPCAYTLWYKGSYFMSVRHFNGEHIMGSPFAIEVDDGATEAATSFAQGQGLVGGVAGEQLVFTVTARDVRQYEYQAVYTNATVVPAVAERQTVTVSSGASGAVSFLFRGESTGSAVSVGASWADVEAALEALATIDDVELPPLSQTTSALAAGSSFDVLFVGVGVRGDVPALKGSFVSSSEARKGDAPYVHEVQTLSCRLPSSSVPVDVDAVAFEVLSPVADVGGVGGFRVGTTASTSAGGYTTVLSVSANATIAEFEAALSLSLATEVTVSTNGAGSKATTSVCAVGGGPKLFLTFAEARGDLRALAYNATNDASFANATVVAESGGAGGSVDGVHPLWGDFTLSFKGYTTRPLSFDASALEVEAALERLPSVGGVTVQHVVAGRAVDTLRADFYPNATANFDYWLVGFDGVCGNSTQDWAECPEHIGDEPLLFANGTGLKMKQSPHVKQAKPFVGVVETKPGSAGNNRAYGSDGQNVQEEGADFTRLGVALVHETAVATPLGGEHRANYVDAFNPSRYDLREVREQGMKVAVGNFEVQALECVSSGLDGSFELYFLGDTLTVHANTTLALLQKQLHASVEALSTAAGHFLYPPSGDVAGAELDDAAAAAAAAEVSMAVTVAAADGVQETVCAHREPSPILLSFRGLAANRANPAVSPTSETELNYGTLPEVNATAAVGAVVKTYEVTKGLDFVRYVGDGRYEVGYTPTVKGRYDMVVTIGGVEVSTDLSNGVFVTPAPARAAQVEHSCDSVAIEGVTERFTIQSRDAFDNTLDGHARGEYTVTLDGSATHKASGFPTAGGAGIGFLGDAGVSSEALWGEQGLRSVVERPLITSLSPNTDGVYDLEWMPRVAGTYTFSANYTDVGGLLATYFRQPDGIAGAILTDDKRFTYPYHAPNHCPSTQLSAEHGFCDSTQLDATVSFDWGEGPPSSVLVLDHTAGGRGHSDGRDGRTTHPPAANFPTDFWSARWEGFVDPTPPASSSSSSSSMIVFELEADEDGVASVAVDGREIVGAGTNSEGNGPRVVGNWTVPSTASARSVNGVSLWPITVKYSERTREAKVVLRWSFDGGASFREVPSNRLYHTRHVEKSPYTFLVYPGEVDPTTSSASGDGLTDCTTMRTCFFTIQGRDSMANQRFNSGDDDWLLTLTGVEGWASEGRVNDQVFEYTDDKQYRARERRVRGVRTVASAYYPEFVPLDWELLGSVEAILGLNYVNVSSAPNVTFSLSRGDTIVVGNETLVVDTDPSARFDAGVIPLADPYRSPSGTYKLWKGGERTGTYRVSYHPKVRGDYRLDVQRPAIPEVQVLETFVDPGSPLGGNFSLVFQGLDILSGLPLSVETGPISFNASAQELEAALASLPNVDMVNVTKENCANAAKKCKWAVTFDRIRFEPSDEVAHLYSAEDRKLGELYYPNLVPDVREMRGNNASIAVTEVTKGRPPLHVEGSPFFVHVATNDTHPPTSTAFGQGLHSGVTGETSKFTIQSKDDFGNDRTDDQSADHFLVVPFLADEDYDVFESKTSFAPDRTVRTHLPPTATVAAGGSGTYDVEFVPTISGDYTVAVLVALKRERQRVVTSFPTSNPKRREGSWTLMLRHSGAGVGPGSGAADSLHIPETALVETSALAWDATAENVKQALLDLGGVCGSDISVERSDLTHSEEYFYDYPSRHAEHESFGATSAFGFTYDITFHDYVGDLPLLMPNFALTLVGGTVNASSVVDGTCEHVKTEASPLVKETQVVRVASDGAMTGSFVLGFRGHATANLAWDSTAAEVKEALEALLPIGSVSVERNATKSSSSAASSVVVGFEYTVVFEPEAKCNRRHALNFGDLPSLTATSFLEVGAGFTGNFGVNASVTVYSGGFPSRDGTPTYDGSSPFSKSHAVVSSSVSAQHTTAVDSPAAYGLQGLRTGTYNATSTFTIESRDRFSNRVLVGPLKERQIVTTQCSPPCNLLGSFTVSYRGHSVELDAGAGIAELESSLEALDTLGSVTVTTYGVHDPVGSPSQSPAGTARVGVVKTDPDVYPATDLSAHLSVGDWVRLDAHDGFVYSVVSMKPSSPFTIRLNKPYEGLSNPNASVWRQDRKSHVQGYQYIVEFDSNSMGDLPALVVNGTGLLAGNGGNETRAAVTWCDWQQRQTVTTSASSMINGTFYLVYGGERTRDLPFSANASEVEAELNSLDTIYACAVEPETKSGPFGTRSWTVNLHSVGTQGGKFEPIFAEGHLLLGAHVRIDVHHDCATNGRGAFPHQCNTTNPDTGGAQGSFLVHGCEVQAVAGRLGSEYLVALEGETVVSGSADHVGQGLYRGEFLTPRTGSYELTVAEAQCCGLQAELFNNRWLIGEPVLTRVDPLVDFVWSAEDLISPTGRDYVSVRWSGWVRPTFSEEFEFVLEINDGARLFLDGELLLDAFEDEVSDDESNGEAARFSTYRAPTSAPLVAERLYHVKLEYRESTGAAVARLMWQSASQPLEVVPSHRLSHATTDIVKSPFAVSPMPIEPLQVVDVSLSIAGWDSLNVFWFAPWDDGGSEVDGFKVEWWSAVAGAYGAKEKQTLKFASNIDAGSWYLRSPGGIVHHSALPWNVTTDVLELALETFADVGDVSVRYSVDAAKGSRNYHVTFETDLGNVTSLGIDSGNLAALDGSGITTAVVCAHGKATSALCNTTDSVAGNSSLWGSTTNVDLVNVAAEEGEPYHIVIPDLGQKSSVTDGFSVRVYAHTAGGMFQHDRHKGGLYGLASPPVTLKPMAVPEAPGHTEARLVPGSDDSLRVHWTDVTTDPAKTTGLLYGDRCSPVDAYLVEWDTSPLFDSNSNGRSTAQNPNPTLSSALGSSLRSPDFYQSPRVPNATDATWFSYVVSGLEPGAKYYIRVTARNVMGLGAHRVANTESKEQATVAAYASLAPRTSPVQLDFGAGVSLSTVPAAGLSSSSSALSSSSSLASLHGNGGSGSVTVRESTSSLLVQFTAPGDERGSSVLDYLVEWWRADDFGRHEVQVIQTATTDSGLLRGTFEVSYDGFTTDTLPYDISEEAMEIALEGLEPLRDVQVTRRVSNSSMYEWTVTFLSEQPFVDNQKLSADGSGLTSTRSAAGGGSVSAKVGVALTKALPGWHGEAVLDVVQGSDKVTASTGLSFVRVGDWVRLGEVGAGAGLGAIHRVVGKDAANVTFTLETAFEGASAMGVVKCDFGVSVPGKAPRELSSAVVAPFDSLRVGKASYTITGLFVNVAYGVRVSARNDRGLSIPQFSTPAAAAPPQQKPDKPQDVLLLGDSDTSLRVLFNMPDDDGGVTVTKYKIEWDSSPLFTGGVGGSVLGSHHKVLSQPVGACGLTPCEYIISGLAKGTRYHVRVFAYNKFGFSVEASPTSPPSEVPCTFALPPSAVSVSPVGVLGDALEVRFAPSEDDGGCPVTKYKVEWDPAGALGFQQGATPSRSLLYGKNEVQVVTVASFGKNDLGGSFRLALDDVFCSDPIATGASAAVVEAELNNLATAGGVKVSRNELKLAGRYGFAYTVTFVGAQGGGKRWVGDVAALKVSTNSSDFPSEFKSPGTTPGAAATAEGGTLTGSGPPSVTATTAVDGARGFEQQQVQLWASSGGLRGTFRVGFNPQTLAHEQNEGGALSAPLPWNASAAAVADALASVGAGPNVRVARELDLHAMTEVSHASSRLVVSQGLGGWDGADSGIRYVVVFEGSTLAGSLPLITVDGSGLRSTNYSAAVKHNVSTLVVGETPTLDSALKGQAVLAVDGGSVGLNGAFVDLGDDGMPSSGYFQARDPLFVAEGAAKNQEPSGVYGDGSGGGGGAPVEGATWDAASGSYVKTISGLVSGEAYHVRVSAYNGFGKAYGGVAYATPTPRFGLEKYGVK
jgi:hypothetical protein